MDRAAVTAEGPGMGIATPPECHTAAESFPPGSDIPGVPASDTKATFLPLIFLASLRHHF